MTVCVDQFLALDNEDKVSYSISSQSVESQGLNFILLYIYIGILTGQLLTKHPQIWLAELKYIYIIKTGLRYNLIPRAFCGIFLFCFAIGSAIFNTDLRFSRPSRPIIIRSTVCMKRGICSALT